MRTSKIELIDLAWFPVLALGGVCMGQAGYVINLVGVIAVLCFAAGGALWYRYLVKA